MPYGQSQPSLKRQMDDSRALAEYAKACPLRCSVQALDCWTRCSTVWRVQIANANENDYPSSPSPALSLFQRTFTQTVCLFYITVPLRERERERAYITAAMGNAGKPRRPSAVSEQPWTRRTTQGCCAEGKPHVYSCIWWK